MTDLKDFGAKADGVTDDAPALQGFLDLQSALDKIDKLEAENAELKADALAMRNALNGAGVVVMGEQEWRWMEEGEQTDE